MNWFTTLVRRHRWLFNLKIKWDSLGLWSRLRRKNKVMAYLLRRPRRNSITIWRLRVMWLRPRGYHVTSSGIRLPDPPVHSYKRRVFTIVQDFGLRQETKVVFDNRQTNVVLDDIRKKILR